jgi:RNA polymerase sigma factor for flagellar operon FliA
VNATVAPDEEATLWESFRRAPDADLRTRLIELHLPFARIMAAKVYAGRPSNEFEFDEYLQFATMGMLECVDRYDPVHGASFRTYASQRMVGAILSGLERLSEKQQQIAVRKRLAAERVESLRGDEAAPGSPEALFASLARIAVGLALGSVLEDSGMYRTEEVPGQDTSYQSIELRQLQQRVRALVDTLPDRERRIIRYHYLNRLPFDHVAEMLGVSKGRVSQLHRRAMDLLRDEARKVKKCDLAW